MPNTNQTETRTETRARLHKAVIEASQALDRATTPAERNQALDAFTVANSALCSFECRVSDSYDE